MIEIGINPILIAFGPFNISWHGLFMTLGIIVGVGLPVYLASRAGLSADNLFSLALWAVPGGIIGARLVHVIDFWGYYLANPGTIFALWEGGLALWGGILGGTITGIAYARVKKFPVAGFTDLAAMGMILAQAIGRIGDIINGEHISSATSLPWGVVYTHPYSPGFGLPPVHPAVGYEFLMDLLIFGLLWILRRRVRPEGSLFLIYLTVYSAGRFFLSFLRLDSNTVLLSLNQPQWISLLVLAVTIPLWIYRKVSFQKQKDTD